MSYNQKFNQPRQILTFHLYMQPTHFQQTHNHTKIQLHKQTDRQYIYGITSVVCTYPGLRFLVKGQFNIYTVKLTITANESRRLAN